MVNAVFYIVAGMYLETVASRSAQVADGVLLLSALGADVGRKHDYLRAEVRVRAGRQVEPSAGIADTQSVKLLGR